MERKDIDNLIKKAMALDAMDLEEPGMDLVKQARNKVMMRKRAPEATGPELFDGLFVFLRHQLKFYQVGFSVLVTCVCLFYSIEMNVESRNGHDLSNYNSNALSIRNTTISVNSSTILTSIPTLRN